MTGELAVTSGQPKEPTALYSVYCIREDNPSIEPRNDIVEDQDIFLHNPACIVTTPASYFIIQSELVSQYVRLFQFVSVNVTSYTEATMAEMVLRGRSILRVDNQEDLEGQHAISEQSDENVTSVEAQQEESTMAP